MTKFKQQVEKARESNTRNDIPAKTGPKSSDVGRASAEVTLSPEIAAGRAILATEIPAVSQSTDLLDMRALLTEHSKAVRKGDLSRPEAMLVSQATVLQSIFTRLTIRAMEAGNPSLFDRNMKMALRAQAQCRATLETLSNIKNPPVVYARQANMTSGPQQINNGIEPMRAGKNKNAQNQLSGDNDELLSDTRTSGKAGRNDPPLETLGEIDRAKVKRR